MTIAAAMPIGTETQTTPRPIQIEFVKPSIISASSSRAGNQRRVKPSQGTTCGKSNPPITIGLPRPPGLAWAASLLDAATGLHALEQYYRSEEHTSELQSLMRISYAVLCLKKKTNKKTYKS